MRHRVTTAGLSSAGLLSAVALLLSLVACTTGEMDQTTSGAAQGEIAEGEEAAATDMSPEEAEVVATVERLFEAMRTSDGELARSVFHPEARLGRATDEGISFSPADGFIEAIGTPKDEVWDEPIWDWTVTVDGRMGQMWTKYAFYLGENFSHCGSDAFELYRGEDGWQITQLVDTSRREDCWYPPDRTP